MKRIKFGLFFLVCGLAIIGCDLKEKLEKAVTPAEAVEAMEEYVGVNRIFQAASNSTDESVLKAEVKAESSVEGGVSMVDALKSLKPDEGPIITIVPFDKITWPKTITVNFGIVGITGQDGVTRRGIMTIISSARYSEINSTHTTTFNNYYQNDHKIEGTHVAKNLGLVNNALKFSVDITDGKVTTPDNEVILYTQNTTRTWIAGGETPLNIWDDEYKISGTQSGVSSKGIKYNMGIVKPLHFVVSPRSITSGNLEVNMEGISKIVIDYAERTMTIGGFTHQLGS